MVLRDVGSSIHSHLSKCEALSGEIGATSASGPSHACGCGLRAPGRPDDRAPERVFEGTSDGHADAGGSPVSRTGGWPSRRLRISLARQGLVFQQAVEPAPRARAASRSECGGHRRARPRRGGGPPSRSSGRSPRRRSAGGPWTCRGRPRPGSRHRRPCRARARSPSAVTIMRARRVACSMSDWAPEVTLSWPKIISSAMRPPIMIASREVICS